MYCYLENWCHKKRKVEIPDGTKEIAGVIISGDEILVYPLFCDPEAYKRTLEFFEGSFCRVWQDGKWVDKIDYEIIDMED